MDANPDADDLRRDQAHLIHSLHNRGDQEHVRVWVSGYGAVLVDENGESISTRLAGSVERRRRTRPPRIGRRRGAADEPAGLCLGLRRQHESSGDRTGRAAGRDCAIRGSTASSSPAAAPRRTNRPSRRPAIIGSLRASRRRPEVISRTWGYHGTTLAAMSATGLPSYWPMFEPRVPGFLQIESPYPYRFHPPRRRARTIRGRRAKWRPICSKRRSFAKGPTPWPPSSASRCKGPAA